MTTTPPSEEPRATTPDPRARETREARKGREGRDGRDGREARGRVEHALLHGMLDPVLAIDGFGIIQMASHSVRPVLGYAPDELVGRNINLLMPEPHRSAHDGYLAHYRATGETNILNRLREFQVVRKDGTLVEIELSVARVDLPGSDAPLFIGSFRDVSERKRAQRAEHSMLRALATLGRSAAMLAHEIKNPITSVNLALRAVADQLGADHQEILEDLVRRMQRLELQLRQTLSFARPLELRRTECRVRDLVDDVARSLDPVLRRDRVRLDVQVDDDVPAIDGDPLRLEEVLTNLVRNAVEALERGGRVRVAARREGELVALHVEDDGAGVAPALAATIFEPFVTSKAEGTGLGLAISRRVVEEHGGSLDLDSAGTLGGASFRILLPAWEGDRRRRAPSP